MISLILSASRLMISSVNIDISATLPPPPPLLQQISSQTSQMVGMWVGWCKAGGVDHFHTLPICYHDNLHWLYQVWPSGLWWHSTHLALWSSLSPGQSGQSGKQIFDIVELCTDCSPLTGFDSLKNLLWCQEHFNLPLDISGSTGQTFKFSNSRYYGLYLVYRFNSVMHCSDGGSDGGFDPPVFLFCVMKPISNQGDYPQCQHSTWRQNTGPHTSPPSTSTSPPAFRHPSLSVVWSTPY